MTDAEIEKLWDEFADIPVDAEDCIETNFYRWAAGTDKEIIWHWFDKSHSEGLVKGLMKEVI